MKWKNKDQPPAVFGRGASLWNSSRGVSTQPFKLWAEEAGPMMRNHGGRSPKGRGFSMQLCCTQRAQILLGISNRASGAQASDAQKWFHHKWLEKRRQLCNRQTLLCTEPEKLPFNPGQIASSLKCNPHGVTSKDEQGYYGHCHWGR